VKKKRRFKARGNSGKSTKSDSGGGGGGGGGYYRGGNPKKAAEKDEGKSAPDGYSGGGGGYGNSYGNGYSSGVAMFNADSTTLDQDLFAYLVRIQEDLNAMLSEAPQNDDENVFDELPPVVLLAQNALSEITPRIHEVAMDPMGSRLLQSLIKNARNESVISGVLGSLLSLGTNRVVALAQHRCASHVLQDSITVAATVAGNRAVMEKLVGVVTSWDFYTIRDIISEGSGSHVMRAIFAVLAGIPMEEPRESKLDDSNPVPIVPYFKKDDIDPTPLEWHKAITHVVEQLMGVNPEQIQKLVWTTASSGALQVLIAACTVIDRALSKKLVKICMGENLSDLVWDTCGSRFIEHVVTCLGAGIIWDLIKNHLSEMIADRNANFVVQRVLLNMKGRAQVKAAWDILEPKIPEMLKGRKNGVVLAMCRAAEAEGGDVLQKRAAKAIAKALNATGEDLKHFIGAVIMGSMNYWKSIKEEIASSGFEKQDVLKIPTKFNTINVLLARCLLRYKGSASQTIRDSMGALSQLEILALAANSGGSRVLEQWMELNVKNCTKFLHATLMHDGVPVIGAARSPYGTQLLARCIPLCGANLQKKVMDILVGKLESLKTHRFGSIVVRKCKVDLYNHRPDDWMSLGSGRESRARIFADILNDAGGSGDTNGRKKEAKTVKVSK